MQAKRLNLFRTIISLIASFEGNPEMQKYNKRYMYVQCTLLCVFKSMFIFVCVTSQETLNSLVSPQSAFTIMGPFYVFFRFFWGGVVFGSILVRFQFVFGSFLARFWFVFSSFCVSFWFVIDQYLLFFGSILVCFWLVFSSFFIRFGSFSVRFLLVFGQFLVCFGVVFGSFLVRFF